MANSVSYIYDIAIRTLAYTRFGSILGISELAPVQSNAINLGVVLCPKGIAQRHVAEKRGETFLEFINIHPSKFEFSWKRQRTSVSRRGLPYVKSDNTVGIITADAVDINYDMWFWSSSLDKVRQCMEKYIQWQHDTPKITMIFADEFTMNPDIRFSAIVDESDIEDVFNTGKIWVYKMTVAIEGWLPKLGTAEKEIHKIRLTTYDSTLGIDNYTVIAVEDGNQDTEMAAALKMFQAKLYGIEAVNSVAKTFTVAKDRTADFVTGAKFRVENSTENNEMYTVVSSIYAGLTGQTTILVLETIVGDTADGNLYLHEED